MIAVLDIFDLVLVINLDHRKDRLREMEAQLATIGLSFDDPRVQRLSASCPEDAGAFPSNRVRGCFESHLRCLELAIDMDARSVLVLEDDCDFVGSVGDVLDDLSREDRWSIFYGGHAGMRGHVDENGRLAVVHPAAEITGLHCFGLRGEVIGEARRYLSTMLDRPAGDPLGGPMHVDGAYSWFRRDHPEFVTVLASPMIAVQRASRSDIADLRLFDRIPGLRAIVNWLRRFKR